MDIGAWDLEIITDELMTPVALTIAGSDPSGGAGIQADLKTFHQFEVYGMSVLTLLTIQNTKGIREVMILTPDKVIGQLDHLLGDMPPQAAKTGALGNEEIIHSLAKRAKKFEFPLVVDPVMASEHGAPLLTPQAFRALKKELLPEAALVTPNLNEAEALSGVEVKDVASMEKAARKIAALGPKAVLVTGGHLKSDAADVLFYEGHMETFSTQRIDTKNTHGSGCAFSACITAELAKGTDLKQAIKIAKRFITHAIQTNPGLGQGAGPVNHHASL